MLGAQSQYLHVSCAYEDIYLFINLIMCILIPLVAHVSRMRWAIQSSEFTFHGILTGYLVETAFAYTCVICLRSCDASRHVHNGGCDKHSPSNVDRQHILEIEINMPN